MVSTRAEIVTRRTYNRPKDNSGKKFETWTETIDRVIRHQRWLWERAKAKPWEEPKPLNDKEEEELEKLRVLFETRKALPSGRTLWLGGTEVAKKREASQFNCSFLRVETVYDIVDSYWLLLQGCGVGFEPVVGTLNGFSRPVELEVIRSAKTDPNDKGNPDNVEWFREGTPVGAKTNHIKGASWHIRVGDSAEAWAKLPGKLLANKIPCEKLTLDFSEIRPAGTRLSSYGWISSGDELIAEAMTQMVRILNLKNNRLLSRIDIMDILNLLGSTLSSRRSAEICLVPFGDPETYDFINAKKDLAATPWRTQSNNTLLFYHKPSEGELTKLFETMVANGGSEPGFYNAQSALKRAPWFKGTNPCGEILLSNHSFCNLMEIDLSSFNGAKEELYAAARLIGRANYRQTCVNLEDNVLQRVWHENNEFLHLCGVGITGIVGWEHLMEPKELKAVMRAAGHGANNMATELRLPLPKAITTVKPSGTLSKIMDTTEGVHKPLGRYIFNNVKFSVHDPLVANAKEANYRVFDDPYNKDAVLVTFPVEYPDVTFDTVGGKDVNTESAIDQLERYRWVMDNYVEHNCSITVSYDPSEIPGIVSWLMHNWDTYVGVSFILRNDPTKTAEDLGYAYLPQEVVTKETYDAYVKTLKKMKLVDSLEELKDEGCSTGACPIR